MSMSDFKQRLADWRGYKKRYMLQIQTKGIVMDADLGLRSMSWFLLQPVVRRVKREEKELAVLEKMLEESLVNVMSREFILKTYVNQLKKI